MAFGFTACCLLFPKSSSQQGDSGHKHRHRRNKRFTYESAKVEASIRKPQHVAEQS